MTDRLPTYGRAIAAAAARRLVTGDAVTRLRVVCAQCDEDAANCRCPQPVVTWVNAEPHLTARKEARER